MPNLQIFYVPSTLVPANGAQGKAASELAAGTRHFFLPRSHIKSMPFRSKRHREARTVSVPRSVDEKNRLWMGYKVPAIVDLDSLTLDDVRIL